MIGKKVGLIKMCICFMSIFTLASGQNIFSSKETVDNCKIKDHPSTVSNIQNIVHVTLNKILSDLNMNFKKQEEKAKALVEEFQKLQNEVTILKDASISMPINRGDCPYGWIKHGTSCYGFVERMYSWEEAKVYCEVLQSQLVHIETYSENNFLKQQLQTLDNSTRRYDRGHQCWIGGSDAAKEGTWTWTSGSRFTFTDWGQYDGEKPEPSGGRTSNCATMFKMLNYQWNDAPCFLKLSFICEKPI